MPTMNDQQKLRRLYEAQMEVNPEAWEKYDFRAPGKSEWLPCRAPLTWEDPLVYRLRPERPDEFPDHLRKLAEDTDTLPEDWEPIGGPETGVGVENWYKHADGREAYACDDQGDIRIDVFCPKAKKFTSLFGRIENGFSVSAAAHLTLETRAPGATEGSVLGLFETAMARWIYLHGQNDWEESCGDFNIGDFLNLGLHANDKFGKVLREYGLRVVHAEGLPMDRFVNFDRVIVDQVALDEFLVGTNYDPLSHWSEHPEYPVEDWKGEVVAGDTRQGYHEWVASQIELEQEDGETEET